MWQVRVSLIMTLVGLFLASMVIPTIFGLLTYGIFNDAPVMVITGVLIAVAFGAVLYAFFYGGRSGSTPQ